MARNKVVRGPLKDNKEEKYQDYEIERTIPISQDQLNNAKLFNSRYQYAQTLNKNISYLELGVAYGGSAQMFIDTTNAKSADLVDLYNNASGTRETGDPAPKNSLLTHEEYIKDRFSYHPNINTIKGDAKDIVPTLNNKYDFVFVDMEWERFFIKNVLLHLSKLINIDGIIGFTSYINYDAIHYDVHVGISQSVNEFLYFNQNWSVDAIVLNDLGFHEIYIKRNS